MFTSIEELQQKFAKCHYIIDRSVATTVYLAVKMQKPLLVEGPAGSGKTELAKVLAEAMNYPFVRLQCYEGLDEAKTLYEWNYQKQLLYLNVERMQNNSWEEAKKNIFASEFLLERPLLKVLTTQEPVVLLIDEVDKSDQEFESFLLEILSDYQITIPELGSIKARHIPIVVLTSNNFRDFGDALKRRCIHLNLNYPTYEREQEIIYLKMPTIKQALAKQIVHFVQNLRAEKLKKVPSIAETIDWAQAILTLGADHLDEEIIESTLGILLKYRSDVENIKSKKVSSLL